MKYVINPHSIDPVVTYYDSEKHLLCRNKSDLLFDFDSSYPKVKEYLPKIHYNKNTVAGNRILFPNDVSVWTYSMLSDYFNFMGSFISRLDKLGLTLKDYHPWNVVFDSCKPCFVDLGSIIAKPKTKKQKGFCYKGFAYYKKFMYSIASRIYARIRVEKLASYKKLSFIYYTSSGICTRRGLSDRKGNIHLLNMFRDVFLSDPFVSYSQKIKRIIKFVSRKRSIERNSRWNSYVRNVEAFNAGLKSEIVESVLNRASGKYILDVGCNTGYYSILAANRGYEVLALDKDETVVNQLYLYAKKHRLKITTLAADLELYNIVELETPPVLRFYNFDVVICLALLHHLVHSQGHDFFSFFDTISRYSPRYLLVEFVDYGDKYLSKIRDDLKKTWYNVDSFLNAGFCYFSSYELFDFHDKGRRFVLFKR